METIGIKVFINSRNDRIDSDFRVSSTLTQTNDAMGVFRDDDDIMIVIQIVTICYSLNNVII